MSQIALPASAAARGWVRRQAIGRHVPSATTTPTARGAIGAASTCTSDPASRASASARSVRSGGFTGSATVMERPGGVIRLGEDAVSAPGSMSVRPAAPTIVAMTTQDRHPLPLAVAAQLGLYAIGAAIAVAAGLAGAAAPLGSGTRLSAPGFLIALEVA